MKNTFKFAYFAGGCFWCTEAIYLRINGVISVVPGYCGGSTTKPTYEEVCTGNTGHAETIKIEYDSEIIDYYALVDIFFNMHDPTTLNQQGNDIGTHYRSVIFYVNDQEKQIILDYIDDFQKAIKFKDKVFTEVKKLDIFHEAEDYHKNYYTMNKNSSYCSFTITPKVTKFMDRYKEMLRKIT